MALRNKFLSPTCAPAHGDIAPYFFFEKIFRSGGGICVSMTPFGHEESSKYSKFRTKSRYFADNSAGWNLTTNSFHQHVRLLMEISPHTFFLKKYFDPMEEYVFQWRHFVQNFGFFRSKWRHWNTYSSTGSKYFFEKNVCGDISMSRRTCWWKEFVVKFHPAELSAK